MKKLAIFGGIIVVLFAAIIVLTNMSNNSKLENNPYGTKNLRQSTIDQLDDKNYQNIILPDALEKKIATGEPVYAYIFSPECMYCKQMTPKLMPAADESGIHIDQLNVLEFPEQWNKYNLEATPTLIYFDKGQEVTRMVGDYDVDTINSFFQNISAQ
ncbi:thioredoxin family protein [Metasolibacillus meyeri]|uniref:Thioredoxin family protein n=1 Tax=Metasolibacillus meyeri TaxID=1071052 RepID=A0AAW9NMU7_9BACL|nr:thioredoxin family protein [Metasolibacillus meyeri]MEC1176968.1 thioredoxin family protein [Metasolibacillus meyeri]